MTLFEDVKTMEQSKVKEEVWQTIQALNRAWAEDGNVKELENYFHKDMMAITPFDHDRLEGREACIASWRRFVESTKIHYSKDHNPKVQVYGDGRFAVVTCYYDMSYDRGGQTIKSAGRDMFVLVNENGKWLVVADQFSPYPKQ